MSCFLLSDILTSRLFTAELIGLMNAAPRSLTSSRHCTMSERPGNLLTLHINKTVKTTDTTHPSIIFHWNRGVMRHKSGAFFIVASPTTRVCVRECVGEGEWMTGGGKTEKRERRGVRPCGSRPSIQTGFGLIPSLVLEATSDTSKVE